jgi:MFS family permease
LESKRPLHFLLSLNSVHLGTNYLWISFESLILPLQLEGATGASTPGLEMGVIAFIAIAVGVFFSLFSGVLSDNHSILWGKRGPYIIIGTLFTIVAVAFSLLPIKSVLVVFVIFLSIQIGSNISSGAYQPLLRDLIQENQRGTAAGINGVFTLTGTAMGLGLTGFLISVGVLPFSLMIIVIVLLATASITTLAIRRDDEPMPENAFHPLRIFLDIFNPNETSTDFFWLVGASFLFFLGITGLSFFELYYFSDVLMASDPASLVAISGIFVLVFSALGAALFGSLSDRYGRWKILLSSTVIAGFATALIPTIPTFTNFLILGSFIGISYGTYFTVSKALASDMAPPQDAGKYMAYYNIAVGGSSAFSTLFYGIVLEMFGTSYRIGFTAIFEMSAAFYFIGLFFLFRLRKNNRHANKFYV